MGSSSSEVSETEIGNSLTDGLQRDSRVRSGIKIYKLFIERQRDFGIHGCEGLGFKVIFGATDQSFLKSQIVSF